jgi:hypothetical protein
MLSQFQFGGPTLQSSVRHLLCLLLALTFLYNPFLGATPSAKYPSVSHPPSFRATVASSELLKFKPKEQGEIQVVQHQDFALPAVAVASDSNNPVRFAIAGAPSLVQHLPSGNLWFRPPPVA